MLRKYFVLALGLASALLFSQLLTAQHAAVPSNTWAPANSLATARSGATAIVMYDGRVLVVGGFDSSGVPLQSVEIYNADGTVSAGPPLSVPRANHAAIALDNDDILVTCGVTAADGTATASAELFDPAKNTWTPLPALTQARSGHTMSLLKSGKVLVAGGKNTNGPVAALEIFDPTAMSFAPAGALAVARASHAVATLLDGRVMIVGGSDSSGKALASTEIFDPSTGSVSSGPSLIAARAGHTATTTIAGTVVVIGGNNPALAVNGAAAELRSIETFDPSGTASSFSQSVASLATPRTGHLAFLLPNNANILVVGGTAAGLQLATVEKYTPWTDSIQTTAPLATARDLAAGTPMVYRTGDGIDGLLMVTGGENSGSGPLATTELYGFATVKTDKADYAPGTNVNITGTGWQIPEVVQLAFREYPNIDTPGPYATTDDQFGNIDDTEFAPDLNDVGIRFYLTATGSSSGDQAQNTFTDAVQSTTTLTCTATTVQVNQPVSCTATTTASNADFEGTITFSTSPTGAGTFSPTSCDTSNSPTKTFTCPVTFTPSNVSVLTLTITADFTSKNPGKVDSSFSAPVTITVTPDLTLDSPVPASVPYGTSGPVVFTAHLSDGTLSIANSTVTFDVDSGSVGSAPAGSGTATLSNYSPASLSVGNHTVVALFAGGILNGVKYNPATSNSQTLTVNPRTTSTSVACSPSPDSLNTVTTCTATVTDTDLAPTVTPTGTITFSSSGTGNFGSLTCTLTAGSCFVTYTPTAGIGTHTITAAYGGETIHQTSSGTFGLSVNNPATTTVVTSSLNPSTYGTLVTFTATVTSASGTPTGSVSFYDGGTCSAPGTLLANGVALNSSGVATTGTSTLSATSHTILACYTPTGIYLASSGSLVQTVNKATANITVNPYDVPYDTTAHTASGTATGVGGVDLSADLDLTHTTHTNAGTYSSDSWTFTDSTGNYQNVTATTITDKIEQVSATITVNPYDVPYDTTAHTATGTATGVGGVNLNADLDLTHTTHTNAGTYSSDYWTFTDSTGNYKNVGQTTITDKIEQVSASITVNPYDVPYDTTAHTATGTATGVGGVNLNADLDLTHTTHTNAGTYSTDYWTFTDSTGNYKNVGQTTITDKIEQVSASITVNPYDVPYDTTAHTATGTATGVGGVNLNADLDLTHTTHTNAGTYSSDYWTFTDSTGNYKNVGQTTITDKIEQVSASITVNPYDVPYDTTAHTATGTATGVGGVNLNADLDLTHTTHTNAGTYSSDYWTFTDSTGNYKNVGQTTITDKIEQVSASITVNPYDVPYDTTAHTATGTATGVGGVNLNADLDLTHTTHTNAGTYSSDYWTFTDSTGNYKNVGQTTITDKIEQVSASITVNPYDVPYDTTAHTATGTATGVGGVNLNADLDLTHTTHTNAGTYSTDYWTFTDSTGNYKNVGQTTITDKIEQVSASITVNPYDVPYDTTAHTATGTATGVGGANLNADLDLTHTTHTNAGTYNGDAWSFHDPSGNYADANGTVNDKINQATPNCGSITGYTVTYDGNPHTASGSCMGGGAPLSGLDLSGTTHTLAGTYNGDAWSFHDPSGNYADANGTVNDSIAKAPVTAAAGNYSGTYDGQSHSPSACRIVPPNALGYIGNLTCSNSLSSVGADVGSGAITPIVSGDTSNFSIRLVNGTWSISALGVTLTAGSLSGTYNGSAQSPSACGSTAASFVTCTNNPTSVGPDVVTGATITPSPHYAQGNSSDYTITSNNGTATISAMPTTITVTFPAVQYSDPDTFSGTVGLAGAAPAVSGTVTVTAHNGTLAYSCTSAATTGGIFSCTTNPIMWGPGRTYTVTATFAPTSTDYRTGSAGPMPFTITQEDARSYYTGDLWVGVGSNTSGTINLSATIKDITAVDPTLSAPWPDNYPGVITNATVTFTNGGANIAGCINLPVTLFSGSADTTTGTVSCSFNGTVGSTGATQYTIGIVVGNYYTRNDPSDDAVVSISQSGPGMITGGGYVVLDSSASGSLHPAPGLKNNFGFNVKYNKASTNLQGNINTIVRSNVDYSTGKACSVAHPGYSTCVYQIKGNQMATLGISQWTGKAWVASCTNGPTTANPCEATFSGKASIQDLTVSNTNPVSLAGGVTFQAVMVDYGTGNTAGSCPSTAPIGLKYSGCVDTINFNATGSGTWFSTTPAPGQDPLTGGNLVVH